MHTIERLKYLSNGKRASMRPCDDVLFFKKNFKKALLKGFQRTINLL